MSQPRTLSQKIWDRHVVTPGVGGAPDLLYIDLHLIHEVTSPQAFDGLRMNGRPVRRPDLTVATEDHNTPTEDQDKPIADEISATQIETLRTNTKEFGIVHYPMGHENNGIVHVMGPEQGLTQPGMTIVCGDSHTATHGAFGSIAFGIGTSEVEHVLATQTLPQARPGTMAITVNGDLRPGVTPKDVILHVIGVIGTGGGIGKIIEYRGDVFENMSMEGRMTVCNMSIEGGAKAGLIAPDETTFEYVAGRPNSPVGAELEAAIEDWKTLATDDGAVFDEEVIIDAADIAPQVSWGTNPAQVMPIDGVIPGPTTSTIRTSPTLQLEPSSTWISRLAPRSRTSRSTPSSSAAARTAGSRICERRPPSPRGARSPTACAPLSYRAPAWSSSRPKPRACRRSSAKPALTGGSRGARCASP